MPASDLVFSADKKQCDPSTARVCQKDPSHGRLTAAASAPVLACLNKTSAKGQKLTLCDYAEPVSLG